MARHRRHRHFFGRLRHGEISVLEGVLLGVITIFVVLPVLLIALYRVLPPPLTSVMVIRAFEGESLKRDWVSLEDTSEWIRFAVIAAEDNRFCEHAGVDWRALTNAASAELEGNGAGGASTLTMQTARNLMLWPGRSYIRKGLELYVATLIDFAWPKERILEVYLNIAEWGPGVFGIEAAAQHHFGVSANQLTRWESAKLAAVLPSPLRLHPTASTGHVPAQARIVSSRIDQLGPLLDCARQ